MTDAERDAFVDEKLTASQAAHTAYREALVAKHLPQAKSCLEFAASLRAEAHAADPDHRAPRWAAEADRTPTHLDTHTSLTAFYSKELAKA